MLGTITVMVQVCGQDGRYTRSTNTFQVYSATTHSVLGTINTVPSIMIFLFLTDTEDSFRAHYCTLKWSLL